MLAASRAPLNPTLGPSVPSAGPRPPPLPSLESLCGGDTGQFQEALSDPYFFSFPVSSYSNVVFQFSQRFHAVSVPLSTGPRPGAFRGPRPHTANGEPCPRGCCGSPGLLTATWWARRDGRVCCSLWVVPQLRRRGGVGASGCVPFPRVPERAAAAPCPPGPRVLTVTEGGWRPCPKAHWGGAHHRPGVRPTVEAVPGWELVRLLVEHTPPRRPASPESAVAWPRLCAPGPGVSLFCVWV